MKKKIFGGIAFAAVALAIAFNLSIKQNGPKLSALVMENVEALAQNETNGKYKYVYYPQPGDPNYGSTKCVCSGGPGELECC